MIRLSSEAQAVVQKFVARGNYDDAEAVLAEALRLLVERDQLTRLKAAIAVGVEQAERGQVVPWTPELLDRLKREAAENVGMGKVFTEKVIPSSRADWGSAG